MRPAAGGGGAVGGNEIFTAYYAAPGIVYPAAGLRVYPFDAIYGSPAAYWSDDTVYSLEAISDFSGSPVYCLTLLAAGTYAIYTTFNVRVADNTFTGGLLGFTSDRGIGPSNFFQGRYGSAYPDHWQNPVSLVGQSELFMHQWFVVRSGTTPVHVTPDVILNGAGSVQAMTALNAVRLSPVDLANV